MQELSGRTAVVTGAASGMGQAFAGRFAAAGMRVVLSDIEEPALDEAVAAVTDAGGEAIGVVTDVSDVASVELLRDRAIEAFGQVNVVCNNAGVAGGGLATGAVGSLDLPDWQWVMNVNFWGVVNGHHVFLPHLLDHGDGHIVNTASMAGHFPGHSAYTASKWAVVGITEGLYHHLHTLESTVGVSCLCPGWVQTAIADSTRNRPEWAAPDPLAPEPEASPEAEAREVFIRDQLASGMAPPQVADLVHDAILADQYWIFTDEVMVASLADRYRSVLEGTNPPRFDIAESLTQTN